MTKSYRKLKLDELNRISPEKFKEISKNPIVLILDNIRSLNNIGSFFRIADAFRIKEVWLCGFTAQPPHREINKTALGATDTVKWRHFPGASELIAAAQSEGISLIAVEQSTNSTGLDQFNASSYVQIGLIFGNEVEGVSDTFINNVEEVIEIPQEGTKHSLNVSVSAGIAIWEVFKQMRE